MSTKEEWDAAALSIAGQWSLCADCDVELAGKKLFRQVNLNRQMKGLGELITPTVPPPVPHGGSSIWERTSAGPGEFQWYCVFGDADEEVLYVPRAGLALTQIISPPILCQTGVFYDSETFIVNWFNSQTENGPLSCDACTMEYNGWPGLMVTMQLTRIS